MVSLTFPQSHSQNAITLSAKDNEVQEAVEVIGDTLVADGFVRDRNAPEAGVPSFVTSYSKFDAEGRVSRRPLLWFENNRLVVVFTEGRAGARRLNTEERKLIHVLQQQLISRYGNERVRVERHSI